MGKPYQQASEYLDNLDDKIKAIQDRSAVDFGFYGLLEPKTTEAIP